MAASIAIAGLLISFYVLVPRHELSWEPYSKFALEKYLKDGRPVFVDATADWCATCKANEWIALNRRPTVDFFRTNGIVALKADNTRESVEINELLDRLGNRSHGLPYYALFTPGETDPVHFNGAFISARGFLQRIAQPIQALMSRNSTAVGSAPNRGYRR